MSSYKKQRGRAEDVPVVSAQAAAGTYLMPDHFQHNDLLVIRESYETALALSEGRVDEPRSDALLILANTEENTALQQGLKLTGTLGSLVVGRHEMTPYRVDGDSSLSLRHALVILSKDSDDSTVARVIDLHSSSGIFTADGRMHHSIASNGPLALRVGESALFVLFPEQFAGGRLPDFDDVDWTEVQERSPEGSVESELRSLSRVSGTCMDARSAMSSQIMSHPPDHANAADMGSASAGRGQLKFEIYNEEEETTCVDLSHDQLVAGCLIGRMHRCHINEDTVAFSNFISRVHCLLIDIDDHVHIFDLASTNGIWFNDFPVENLKLPDRLPSPFTLCGEVRMTWYPR